MPNYRLYCLSGMGKIEAAEWISADSDAEALSKARAMKLNAKCEIWIGDRMIAALDPHRT